MADSDRILLEIVTPNGVALTDTVDELTAPSVNGDFGVLPGHCSLLAALRTGLVTYRKGAEEERVAVGPGYAEITQTHAVLLTDRFIKKADVDPIVARQELREADEALASFDAELGGTEHGILIRRERWAATCLELYGDPPPPTVHTFDEFGTVAHPDYTEVPEGEAAPTD